MVTKICDNRLEIDWLYTEKANFHSGLSSTVGQTLGLVNLACNDV